MVKRIITLLLVCSIMICFSFNNVYASGDGWYRSEITLPKYLTTGQLYWLTRIRKATIVNTGTGVSYPTYKVYSRICSSSGKYLSNDLLHATDTSAPRWHYTDVVGANIKAAFRNSQTNTHTNKVNLRWKP